MTASILPGGLDQVSFEAGGARLIHDLTLNFETGPLTVILGPNGAGKSLTLRLAHGLIEPTAGRVHWQGGKDARQRQAMVFQRPVLMRRTAAANVDFALKLRGVPRHRRLEQRRRIMLLTGLTDIGDRPARVLSAGEQQRLALARAWAIKPEVLFLDEPTSNLDPTATRAVETIVTAIHETGAKIIMTTHDLTQARRLAQEVVFLHRGKLVERAPAKRFFSKPETTLARAFLSGELIW